MSAPRVVVFGSSGYAVTHLRRARELHDAGEIVFAGICDVRPVSPEAAALLPVGGVISADADEVFDGARPQIAVVATPPHTHLSVALAAVGAGCHVLVEKPPVLSLAEFEQLASAARGTAVQVGFQSFGSMALPALRAALAAGVLGKLTGVGAAGAWVRRDRYYGRNPWAGRRRLGEAFVVDGALTNPFAHAVASAILVAGQADMLPSRIEVELHHARRIEADDTASARLTFPNGIQVVAAATLCAEGQQEPYVVLHTTRGKARWWYRSDWLEINDTRIPVGPPIDLLRNLAGHVRDRTPLVAPLSHTRAFTAFVQAVRDSAGPTRIPAQWVQSIDDGLERRYVVHGVDRLVEAAAEEMALFSELGVAWAS
ncbi:Gfo/Idh/MocA family oxidoreductase [Actinocrispum sp. NPDC049592]|uniref:Gfo/Idh/MocA family protein n=1 Tax=Actinocrispum sp. NPDC049592 TaxID=3154835 RepID=UPI003430B426